METLAALTAEERSTIEDFIEPYLMQIGLLERTPRGRKVTPKTYKHLGKQAAESFPNKPAIIKPTCKFTKKHDQLHAQPSTHRRRRENYCGVPPPLVCLRVIWIIGRIR